MNWRGIWSEAWDGIFFGKNSPQSGDTYGDVYVEQSSSSDSVGSTWEITQGSSRPPVRLIEEPERLVALVDVEQTSESESEGTIWIVLEIAAKATRAQVGAVGGLRLVGHATTQTGVAEAVATGVQRIVGRTEMNHLSMASSALSIRVSGRAVAESSTSLANSYGTALESEDDVVAILMYLASAA